VLSLLQMCFQSRIGGSISQARREEAGLLLPLRPPRGCQLPLLSRVTSTRVTRPLPVHTMLNTQGSNYRVANPGVPPATPVKGIGEGHRVLPAQGERLRIERGPSRVFYVYVRARVSALYVLVTCTEPSRGSVRSAPRALAARDVAQDEVCLRHDKSPRNGQTAGAS
jgi:hypothetical protein